MRQRGEVVILCSTIDSASLNIGQCLQELGDWKDEGNFRSLGNRRLLFHDEEQTAQKGIEGRLKSLGLDPGLIIFPCRHKSKDKIPWLGGHFTGDAQKSRLATAAPFALRSFLHSISVRIPEGFRYSAEATHHGPIDVGVPSFFAEIGSSEAQWSDRGTGLAVARAIMDLDLVEMPVFLGFGGGHYVQRQTELIFEAGIAFGHLFSSYQAGYLSLELVEQAKEKSGASYAYMDRKSLKSSDRTMVSKMLKDIGIELLKGKEIRATYPLKEKKVYL
jgi:D-aminoacyl-tRNA deacylase